MSEKNKDVFVYVRLRPDTKDRLVELAEVEDRSVSSCVRRILESHLEKLGTVEDFTRASRARV